MLPLSESAPQNQPLHLIAVFSRAEQKSASARKKCPAHLARSGKEHAISVAEEAVLRFHRMVVGCKHALAPRKGAHQHQQA